MPPIKIGKFSLRPAIAGFITTCVSGFTFVSILTLVMGIPLKVYLYGMLPAVAMVGVGNGIITPFLYFPALRLFKSMHYMAESDVEDSDHSGLVLHQQQEGVISVEHLTYTYPFSHRKALEDINLAVKEGDFVVVTGPNGAGKTTTFRILCGLIPATSGKVEVAGYDLRTARASARRTVGYVAQFFSLYSIFSVGFNLKFYGGAYGLFGDKLKTAMDAVVRRFGLTGLLGKKAGGLNDGYKKRLSMAAALMHDPGILFLDEPTSSIDPLARRVFWRSINKLADEGKAIIVTTHFMEEAEYCTRIAIQDRGHMLAIGSPKEVKEAAGLPETTSMNEAFIKIVRAYGKKAGIADD